MTPRSPFKFGVCGKYRETEKFWDSQDQGRGVSVLSLSILEYLWGTIIWISLWDD